MAQYEVPQFIEEETKLIGPFSVRQFLLYLGALVVSFIFWVIFEPWLWIFLSVILFGSISILAFGKVHGRPMSAIFVSAVRFFWNPKRYIWKKETPAAEDIYVKRTISKPTPSLTQEKTKQKALTPEKIRELAKQLDRKSDA